jgi:HPt (histidine-containing phosphotransfer) domain-containing protein
MENLNKHTDLSYLNQLANGSDEFISKMTAIFLEQTPEALENLDKHLAAKDWKALRGTAHKMKSSLSIMGIKELEPVVADLENFCDKEINLDKVPALVDQVKIVCKEAMEELKD